MKLHNFLNKNKLIILLFVFPFSIYSQRSEFKIQYRIGTPLNNSQTLDLPSENDGFYYNDTRSIRAINDQGFKFDYKYNFSKKHKLFLNLNFENSISKDYLHIFVPQPIDNVILKQKRTVLAIGLKKQFSIYDDKIRIEIGAEITKRFNTFDASTYIVDFQPTYYDWMKYSYEINLFTSIPTEFPFVSEYKQKKYNGNYNISILFPLKRNFLLNIDFEYTGGLIYYYSYSYTSFVYTDNSGTPTSINTFSRPNNYIKKNYLFFGIGLSYKFNFSKKMFSWLVD
jgi:hypothetical protein